MSRTSPTGSACGVVVELKRDATPDVVLNQLYRFTQLQTSFGCNMLALEWRPAGAAGSQDDALGVHRLPRGRRLSPHRASAQQGAGAGASALRSRGRGRECRRGRRADSRARPDPATARERLLEKNWDAAEIRDYLELIDDPTNRIQEDGTYRLSDAQARAILDLRLQRLTAMGREEIGGELKTLWRSHRGLSRYSAVAPADPGDHLDGAARDQRRLCRSAPHRDHRA